MNNVVTTHVTISGITCDACLKLIKRRVSTLTGIHDITVKENGCTTIAANRIVPVEEIQTALKGTHYQVQ